jgi:hypothetical protein
MRDFRGSTLLDALRGRLDPASLPHDPSPFLRLAGRHGLVGLVNDALRRNGSANDELQAAARVQEAHTRHQLAVAAEIAAAFRARSIDSAFVKGVAMALRTYEHPGLRPFTDLDILVRLDALHSAEEMLSTAGFVRVLGAPGEPIEVVYRREEPSGIPIWVDLHWDFTGPKSLQAPVRVPVGEILKRARDADGIPIPSDEDSLLLAAANLARSCVDRLILIADFARLAGRSVDWKVVLERARTWRLRTPLWLGLSLAAEHAGATVPADVLSDLRPSSWKERSFRQLLSPESLCRTGKERDPRYRYGFKALCLDSWGDLVRATVAMASGSFSR